MSPTPRTAQCMRAIARHASPILVAQLASISTAVVDTLIAGRAGTTDLAAVGVGNGLYVSVMIAGAGIVQGLTPIAAHHVGAKRPGELAPTFQQGIWLCLALSLLGILILSAPGWLLEANGVTGDVATRCRAYLTVIAWSLPGTLIYRTCGGMLNALGRPGMLMYLGLANAASHALLAPALAFGWLGLAPLGAVGCAASMLINTSLLALAAMIYLARSPWSQPYHLFARWQRPEYQRIGELLHLGLPIGLSSFVEITSFALIGLMVAAFGAAQVGAHRVVSSFAGVCYMLPLSVSIATLSLVGQAAGAQNSALVRKTVRAGMLMGCGASALLGLFLWLFARPIVVAITPDPTVQSLTLGLIALIALYQLFDAAQTIAAQALRGLKITRGPMVVHLFCFSGIGLGGGWWLCHKGIGWLNIPGMTITGFWVAAVSASTVASILFAIMLRRALKRLPRTQG